MNNILPPVVVGAGPAGICAAKTLVAAGLRPIVIDEGFRAGGQIYRRPLIDDGRTAMDLYGSEAAKATRLHREFDALLPSIDYRPQALVWNIAGNELQLMADGKHEQIGFQNLILSTGATDRILPFPGWTLPGVYTLGAAQTALKAQGCTIGKNVVFLGSGPLLYLVAWQYVKAGGNVAAVLDTAPFSAKLNLLSALRFDPRLVFTGMSYAARLVSRGVKIRYNVRPNSVDGSRYVEGLSFKSGVKAHSIACDAVAYGFALRPETQLADLSGCTFRFDDRDRTWLPVTDEAGRTSSKGIYLAGDGSGIAGADAAEISGELAALALIQDTGATADTRRMAALVKARQRKAQLRDILEKAFPFPDNWFDQIPGETQLCRCEEITVSSVIDTVQGNELRELNRLKALSRAGMGRCQGRMCSAAMAEVLSSTRKLKLAEIGRLRAQAPVKPLPLSFQESGS
jgi:NADPH-dependent 2,4-dienoyl-CoA reductase/sulfur reductase-like enzyme